MKSLEDCIGRHKGIISTLSNALPDVEPFDIKTNPDILKEKEVLETLIAGVHEEFDVNKRVNVEEWDTLFVPVLYALKQSFTPIDGKKIKLLLESDDKLLNNLEDISPYLDLKSYNEQVLNKLIRLGVNTSNWIDGSYNFSTELNGTGEKINFKQWDRDFKKEFAIGHYSDCCISLGGDSNGEIYPEVLVDYFIDHSINVIKVFNEKREIGQLYFVALTDNDYNTVLGTTSVELDKAYAENEELAKVITNRIAGDNFSIRDYFGFDRAVMAHRHVGFNKKVDKSINYISKERSSLKARRDKLRNRKRAMLEKPVNMSNKRKFITLKNQINQATQYLKQLDNEHSLFTDKNIDLSRISTNSNYQGTDYLDIFGGKFLENEINKLNVYDINNLSFDKLDYLKEEIKQYKILTK